MVTCLYVVWGTIITKIRILSSLGLKTTQEIKQCNGLTSLNIIRVKCGLAIVATWLLKQMLYM